MVLACALKHHTRRGERDPERWQLASQLVTHGLLRDAGFTLPPDAEAWDGISVEEAYEQLPKPDEGGSGDAGNPPSGSGDAGAGSAGAPMPDGSDPSDRAMTGRRMLRQTLRTMTAVPATMTTAATQAAIRRAPARSWTRRRAAPGTARLRRAT